MKHSKFFSVQSIQFTNSPFFAHRIHKKECAPLKGQSYEIDFENVDEN
jgi:hypothetical protein